MEKQEIGVKLSKRKRNAHCNNMLILNTRNYKENDKSENVKVN